MASVLPLTLLFMFTLAVIPAVIANLKGHNPVIWYLYGCVFFIGALIQSLLLSNQKRLRADPASRANPTSQADELERWARLRDRGLLTDAEFEQKKKQLLEAGPGGRGP